MAEKEGRPPIRQPAAGDGWVPLGVVTVVARLLETEEDQNGRGPQQADGPPELHGEEGVGGDKGRKGGPGNGAEQKGHVQGCEGAAALMQEQQIGDHARPQDGGHGAEEAGEQSRQDEGDVILRVGHEGAPDLADHGAEHAPEDDGAAAQPVGDGGEEEGAERHAGEGGGVLNPVRCLAWSDRSTGEDRPHTTPARWSCHRSWPVARG